VYVELSYATDGFRLAQHLNRRCMKARPPSEMIGGRFFDRVPRLI